MTSANLIYITLQSPKFHPKRDLSNIASFPIPSHCTITSESSTRQFCATARASFTTHTLHELHLVFEALQLLLLALPLLEQLLPLASDLLLFCACAILQLPLDRLTLFLLATSNQKSAILEEGGRGLP